MRQPKFPNGYRLGIVNPLTLVGNEVQTLLRDRAFPYERITLLDSTGKDAGALTAVGDDPTYVAAASDDELEDLDIVIFCGPAAGNREWIARHTDDAFVAVDLSQPSSAEEGKLVVAGINLEDVVDGDDVLLSPHPIAIPIALLLHQIRSLSPIALATATVVQPASEYGQEGVEELAQQTIAVLNIQSIPRQIFDRQVAFNLFPALERNEELVVTQVKTLTDARTQLALLITQGTIFHGHTFSLFVKTEKALTRDEVIDALKKNPAIGLPEGDQEFGTIDAAGKDQVLVADVRPDPSIKGGFWVWAVCDNLRRSSALNAVLVAEKVAFGTGVH